MTLQELLRLRAQQKMQNLIANQPGLQAPAGEAPPDPTLPYQQIPANQIPVTAEPNIPLEQAAAPGSGVPVHPMALAIARRIAQFNLVRNSRNRNALAMQQLDNL